MSTCRSPTSRTPCTTARAALALRSTLPDLRDSTLTWADTAEPANAHDTPEMPDGVLAFRRGRLLCTVNCGAAPVPVPEGASLLLASAPEPLIDKQPVDSAAWWLVRPYGE